MWPTYMSGWATGWAPPISAHRNLSSAGVEPISTRSAEKGCVEGEPEPAVGRVEYLGSRMWEWEKYRVGLKGLPKFWNFPVKCCQEREASPRLSAIFGKIDQKSHSNVFRVVQLNFTPEIELLYMLFDRSLSIFSMTAPYGINPFWC